MPAQRIATNGTNRSLSPGSTVDSDDAQEEDAARQPSTKSKRKWWGKRGSQDDFQARGRVLLAAGGVLCVLLAFCPPLPELQLHDTMQEMCKHLAEMKRQMHRGSEGYSFVGTGQNNELDSGDTANEKRTVYTRFHVINLHNVTAVSVDGTLTRPALSSFPSARLYYELLWELPPEKQCTRPPNGNYIDPPSDWSKEWQPQVGMDNITGEVLTVQEWLGVETHVGRRMAFKRWIGEGTFQQNFDFSEFPFDSTEFRITLRSHLTTKEVELVDILELHGPDARDAWLRGDSHTGSVLRVDKFQLSHYWRIHKLPEIRGTERLGAEPGLKGARPRIQLVVLGKRQAQYYFYNSILIFMIIVSLSFSVFSMPVRALSDRLDIVMSLVLSAVAHKLLCAEQLPDLPYLTRLDGYVLGGVGFLCVLTVECIVCATLFENQTAEFIDTVAGWSLLALWLVVNGFVAFLHLQHQGQAVDTLKSRAFPPMSTLFMMCIGFVGLWWMLRLVCMYCFKRIEHLL